MQINSINNSPEFGKIGKVGKGLGRGRRQKKALDPFSSKKIEQVNKWHDRQIVGTYNNNKASKKEIKDDLHRLQSSYNGKVGTILNKTI